MTEATSLNRPCWYAIHTRNNHEKRVADALAARSIECFLPTFETVSQWKDRRVKLECPLFPGYLFARIPAAGKGKVVTVPSVVNVLCDRGTYDALLDEQVDQLRAGLKHRRAEPHAYLNVGTQVEIVSGPFAGMSGIYIEESSVGRVVISLPSIMRAFVVEVGIEDVRQRLLEAISLPERRFRTAFVA